MERKPFPSETQERFIVRFPDGMRDRIADAAKANNRSMNAEIVARLEQSFQGGVDSQLDIGALASRLAEHLAKEGMQLALIDGASPIGLEARAILPSTTTEAIQRKSGKFQEKAKTP